MVKGFKLVIHLTVKCKCSTLNIKENFGRSMMHCQSNYAKVHQCYPDQDIQCRVIHPVTSQDKMIFQNAGLLLDTGDKYILSMICLVRMNFFEQYHIDITYI